MQDENTTDKQVQPEVQPQVQPQISTPAQVISDVAQPQAPKAVEGPPLKVIEPQPEPQTQPASEVASTSQIRKDRSELKSIVTIIVAVCVGLALIAAAYTAFVGKESTDDTGQAAQEQAQGSDSATVDQDTTEIDGIINELDDTKDFPDEELNDENLGI